MTPAAILTELQTRGVVLFVDGGALHYRAPRGALTPELRQALIAHKVAILAAVAGSKAARRQRDNRGSLGGADLTAGHLAAVKVVNTVLGDLWLVADDDALAAHPDIIRSGLPVFFFDEVEQLRGKGLAEVQALGMLKAAFPTSRVLQ
jgi:hypothetical protein